VTANCEMKEYEIWQLRFLIKMAIAISVRQKELGLGWWQYENWKLTTVNKNSITSKKNIISFSFPKTFLHTYKIIKIFTFRKDMLFLIWHLFLKPLYVWKNIYICLDILFLEGKYLKLDRWKKCYYRFCISLGIFINAAYIALNNFILK
jgi:hypothetical protein